MKRLVVAAAKGLGSPTRKALMRVAVGAFLSAGRTVGPGRRTTLEFLPAVWLFGNNNDFVGPGAENRRPVSDRTGKGKNHDDETC
jgi:hypothetical protein